MFKDSKTRENGGKIFNHYSPGYLFIAIFLSCFWVAAFCEFFCKRDYASFFQVFFFTFLPALFFFLAFRKKNTRDYTRQENYDKVFCCSPRYLIIAIALFLFFIVSFYDYLTIETPHSSDYMVLFMALFFGFFSLFFIKQFYSKKIVTLGLNKEGIYSSSFGWIYWKEVQDIYIEKFHTNVNLKGIFFTLGHSKDYYARISFFKKKMFALKILLFYQGILKEDTLLVWASRLNQNKINDFFELFKEYHANYK